MHTPVKMLLVDHGTALELCPLWLVIVFSLDNDASVDYGIVRICIPPTKLLFSLPSVSVFLFRMSLLVAAPFPSSFIYFSITTLPSYLLASTM